MLSVKLVYVFSFSLGREGLTSDHLEWHWALFPFHTFSFELSGLTQSEGINPAKDLRKASPFGLMIVWVSDRWESEICTWTCENTNWWLSLWPLRYRLWDSTCSCSLTQFLCLWASHITTMTPLINKNERDICDRIYHVKTFIIVSGISHYGGLTSLQCCVFIITSHHLRRCFVFYGGHTSKKSSNIFTRFFITSSVTPSPTIRPSVYISMVHHDNIHVFSFDRMFVCGYVLSWCLCVCMRAHGGHSYFLYLEWKR
jgi:hypothetical protein